jgi:nitrogen fixation/metabolism regulation signal transduction histidine kinase
MNKQGVTVAVIGAGIGGLALLLLLAGGFTLYLRRSVVRPVLTVADASRRLAEGDMSTRVPPVRDDELGDLVGLVRQAEQGFGRPVDVEFCFERRNLWLLQCRPITTL